MMLNGPDGREWFCFNNERSQFSQVNKNSLKTNRLVQNLVTNNYIVFVRTTCNFLAIEDF